MSRITAAEADIDSLQTGQTAINTSISLVNTSIAGQTSSIANATSLANQAINKSKWDVEHNNMGFIQKYTFPDADFNAFPIKVLTDGYQFLTTFNIQNFKHTGGTTYYISPTGSDSNNGLTEGAPRKIFASVPFVHGDTVILLDGIYPRTIWTNDTAIEKSVNIIAKNPGNVIVKNGNDHTYTAQGTANVYYTVRNNIAKAIQVLDDTNNVTVELTNVTSITAVSTTEGSWYCDGTNTYIHLLGEVVPDNTNTILTLLTNCSLVKTLCATENVELYLEGIKFIGGHGSTLQFSASATYTAPKVFANKCLFKHAYDATGSKDAVTILGATAYFVDCEASYSSKDGFNYHAYNTTVCNSIEVNCVGKCNGAGNTGGAYQNGSTAHDGSKAIRINCTYFGNYGANVADVMTGTKSLNLGCIAFKSTSGLADGTDADFAAQQAGATMYLDNCKSFGSANNLYCASGATMNVHHCDYNTTLFGSTAVVTIT